MPRTAQASRSRLGGALAHSLIPILAAYVLAHDRALVLYGEARTAARSQYAMLAIMVGFTTLALWLLAQAGTA